LSWTVETLNETVDAEVEALPEDMRARLARIALLIEEKGLERVGGPHVKHIEGRLWEMRMKGKSGISRALLRGGPRPAHRNLAGLREENRENTAS
jgi:hypothetical protein